MESTKKTVIVVAETAPIICAGLATCLKRISNRQINTSEVHTYQALVECMFSAQPDIVIVNPAFEGNFNPEKLRTDVPGDYKIAAIKSGILDKREASFYDSTIFITDDISTISSKICTLDPETQIPGDSRETLSQREKEIVTLVVKGLTNKEIAETLYLSVHTVITHRRNIARKLEIHSATGLTIYAIVNRLVDLSEIKV